MNTDTSLVALQSGGDIPSLAGGDDANYWHALIDEKDAAAFLGLTDRTMQTMRQRGDSPRYVQISSRCLRYRRIDLKTCSDARVRTSTADEGTSDPGAEAA